MTQDKNNSSADIFVEEKGRGEFGEILIEDTIARCAAALDSVLLERRDFLVQGALKKLTTALEGRSVLAGKASAKDWVDVESLSSLRTLVGGRFASLKKKWVEAGFPLRQHRGDKAHDYKIREEGWIELAAWIAKQGFEAKLAGPDEDCPIKIRKSDDR